MSNKIAQCENLFKQLIDHKSYKKSQLSIFQSLNNEDEGFIKGLEWCIERLGKILDMDEADL